MNKVKAIDEAGRTMALKRYTKPQPQSQYGHSQMGHTMGYKFDTPKPTQGVKAHKGRGHG